jgi:peptidoglycan hydrolase CwlO-like protein
MHKNLRILAFASAFVGMGIAMPQCPGQQAMQQQIDGLEAKGQDTTRRLQAMDAEVKRLNGEFVTAKQLLAQMTDAIQAQKTALDKLNGAMEAQAQAAAAAAQKARAAKPAKAPAKKRR